MQSIWMIKDLLSLILITVFAITSVGAQESMPANEVVVRPFDTLALNEYREMDDYQYGSIEGESVWQIIKRRVMERINRWLERKDGTYGLAVILGVVAILIIALVLMLNVKQGVITAGNEGRKDKIGLFDQEVHVATLPERISQCEAKEDMAGAFRFRFLLLLTDLDAAEVITARKYKTNGEYREEVFDKQPAASNDFEMLADIFDQVFYGGRNLDRNDYEASLSVFERMTQPVAV